MQEKQNISTSTKAWKKKQTSLSNGIYTKKVEGNSVSGQRKSSSSSSGGPSASSSTTLKRKKKKKKKKKSAGSYQKQKTSTNTLSCSKIKS